MYFHFFLVPFLALCILNDQQAQISLFVIVKTLTVEKGRKCGLKAICYICRPAIFGIASEGDVEGVVSGLCVCLQALESSGAFLLLCYSWRMSSLFVCGRLHISYKGT